MIVKYTEQEEQQLKKLGRVAGAKLDRLNQIIRESTKDSEEYKNAIKEATELDYELFKARAAIYNQAGKRISWVTAPGPSAGPPNLVGD